MKIVLLLAFLVTVVYSIETSAEEGALVNNDNPHERSRSCLANGELCDRDCECCGLNSFCKCREYVGCCCSEGGRHDCQYKQKNCYPDSPRDTSICDQFPYG
nr:venom protein [Lampona murina]